MSSGRRSGGGRCCGSDAGMRKSRFFHLSRNVFGFVPLRIYEGTDMCYGMCRNEAIKMRICVGVTVCTKGV